MNCVSGPVLKKRVKVIAGWYPGSKLYSIYSFYIDIVTKLSTFAISYHGAM